MPLDSHFELIESRNMIKRKRRQTPKARTGCSTCKARKVKCGEERPYCRRCIAFGIQCDGYPTNKNHKFINRFKPLQPLPHPTNALSRYAPSVAVPLDGREMKYFQDFVEDSSLDHQSRCFSHTQMLYSDSFFWSGIVLQESHATACTRHALVAIGALGRSMQQIRRHKDQTSDGSKTILSQDPHHEFALMQYHKALQHLRKSIVLSDDIHERRSSIVACLVLACFDTFYGHGVFAAQHIEYAREVVADWGQRNKNLGLPIEIKPDAINNLSRLFLRLDLQGTAFLGAGRKSSYSTIDSTNLPAPIGDLFADFEEAKYIGHLLISKGFNFTLKWYHLRYLPADSIPPEVLRQRQYFIQQVAQFDRALRPVLRVAQAHNPKNQHPFARPQALKCYTNILLLHLTAGWGNSEMACDALLGQFKFIVSIARDVIEYEAKTIEGITVFSFEFRILPMIFGVATKCRDPILRREAIRIMLSAHWKEGIWDSLLCGKTATWMMNIEEEGMDEDGNIPEQFRCFDEKFDLNVPGRIAVVRCQQNLSAPVAGRVEKRKIIKW